MEEILLPNEGVIFKPDNLHRLDYSLVDGLVEVQLFTSKGVQQFNEYTITNYRKLGKMYLTLEQFERFLFSEMYVENAVKINFE